MFSEEEVRRFEDNMERALEAAKRTNDKELSVIIESLILFLTFCPIINNAKSYMDYLIRQNDTSTVHVFASSLSFPSEVALTIILYHRNTFVN